MSLSKDALPNNGHNTLIKENQAVAADKISSAVNTRAIQRNR